MSRPWRADSTFLHGLCSFFDGLYQNGIEVLFLSIYKRNEGISSGSRCQGYDNREYSPPDYEVQCSAAFG
jgi:hypothetical protein